MWLEEACGCLALEEGPFVRGVDRHPGIHLEEMRQAARVIPVPVGDDDGIESRQVDAELPHVALEDLRVVARVEEDALAAVLHQSGESPVLHQSGGRAERVVEDRDAPGFLRVQGDRE